MKDSKREWYKNYVAIDWSQEVVFVRRMMTQAGRVEKSVWTTAQPSFDETHRRFLLSRIVSARG